MDKLFRWGLICLSWLLPACGEQSQEVTAKLFNETAGSSSEELPWIDQLLETYKDELGYPKRPRRAASFTSRFKNDSAFSVGLRFDIAGNELQSTVDTIFTLNWTSNLVLVKHSPLGLSSITKVEGDQIKINYLEGEEFVGLCTYSASANGSVHLVGKAKIFGSGVNHKAVFEKLLEVNQSSYFFPISRFDTLESVRDRCFQDFRMKIKASVIEDLKSIIQANVFYDTQAHASDAELAVDSALFGPFRNDLNVYGYLWGVEKADIQATKDRIVVKGKIWGQQSYWPDHKIVYAMNLEGGQVKILNLKITSGVFSRKSQDQKLENAARKLLALIGEEMILQSLKGKLEGA